MGDRNPSKKSKYDEENGCKLRGVVVLMKKNLLGVNDVAASVFDRFDEIRGRKVALRLISTAVDPDSAGMYPLNYLCMRLHLYRWFH